MTNFLIIEQRTKKLKHTVSLIFVYIRHGCHMCICNIATEGVEYEELNMNNNIFRIVNFKLFTLKTT